MAFHLGAFKIFNRATSTKSIAPRGSKQNPQSECRNPKQTAAK
jgi:hypothetical protein